MASTDRSALPREIWNRRRRGGGDETSTETTEPAFPLMDALCCGLYRQRKWQVACRSFFRGQFAPSVTPQAIKKEQTMAGKQATKTTKKQGTDLVQDGGKWAGSGRKVVEHGEGPEVAAQRQSQTGRGPLQTTLRKPKANTPSKDGSKNE